MPDSLFDTAGAEARKLAGYEGWVDDQLKGPRMRQGVVSARDAATRTCTVLLGGDTTAPIAGVVIPAGLVPRVDDTVWIMLLGTAPLLLVNQTGELPKARLFSTAVQSVAPGSEVFDFNASGGSTDYDTDNDGTDTMADRTNSRLYCRWPGKYRFGGSCQGDPPDATAATIFNSIRLNGATLIARSTMTQASTNAASPGIADEREFAAGDYIQLMVEALGNTLSFGTASNELGARLWLSYIP